jgi:hypothetical protein
MSGAPKKVRVTVMRLGQVFEIKQITNTSWYIPGDHITRDTLKKICEMPDWEVNIIDNDILKTLLGALSNINIIP